MNDSKEVLQQIFKTFKEFTILKIRNLKIVKIGMLVTFEKISKCEQIL